ncbi:hypothetical protein [Dactylosporangium sp. CA-233914]|uniref:hypothetical protein n=1 Tax=Dactylosporangium sp. CA-233914 TaxID=3239934 RepID=UPI003D92E1C0
MLSIVRWVLLGLCLINLIALLAVRGGLGEYVRGGSLTTAHLGTCFDDIEREQSHVTCSARWTAGAREVQGTVTEADPTGAAAVAEGSSGSHIEVRLPVTDVRVFAHGTNARMADPASMAAGGGFLLATLALLAWAAAGPVRRFTARRCVARPEAVA